MHERLHRLQIVVHPREQHALVAQRDAGICQPLQRLFHFNGELARMINVHAHPERMIFRQHRAKLWRDSLRKENRNPRPDAEEFDVWNCPQTTKQILQFAIAKKERVASRKKHVADFGMLLQIAKGFFEISVQFLFPHPTDDAAARAIAAIGSTTVCHQK